MILVLINFKRETRSKLLWIGPWDDISLVTRNPTHHPSGGWAVVFWLLLPIDIHGRAGRNHHPCMPIKKAIICLVDSEEQGQGCDSYLKYAAKGIWSVHPVFFGVWIHAVWICTIFNMLSRACNYEPKIEDAKKALGFNSCTLRLSIDFRHMVSTQNYSETWLSKNKKMYGNKQTSWKSAWHKTTRHTKHEHHHQQQSLKRLHPKKLTSWNP